MVVFDIILEDNIAARNKRVDINQNLLDKAKGYAMANPSMDGAKFIKSLTNDGYNNKGKKQNGEKKGAQNVGDDTKSTNISFADAKMTVSRYNRNAKQKPVVGTDADKPFGILVGDIKKRMDSIANSTKSSVPNVQNVKPVPKVHPVKSNNNNNVPKVPMKK